MDGLMFDAEKCVMQGTAVSASILGELRECSHADDLSEAMKEDGYVFLRGLVDEAKINAARAEVFQRLHEVGEIAAPPISGITTGTSRRSELAKDLGQFWQSVSEGEALRAASHGAQIKNAVAAVLGEAAHAHDYMFLRPGVVGRATDLHYDLPFFARGSDRVFTVWLALGEIPVEDGPLVVVEGSTGFEDLIQPIRSIDYDSKDSPKVQMLSSAVEFAESRGTRLLTADFGPGDAVIFSMTTLHGTLDNHSPIGRTRLSCDVRWQPACDEVDARYRGPNPLGTTGAGYAELNGAKPLTEPWHIR